MIFFLKHSQFKFKFSLDSETQKPHGLINATLLPVSSCFSGVKKVCCLCVTAGFYGYKAEFVRLMIWTKHNICLSD